MCENCAEWFHKECVKTAPAVWKKKEEQWLCVNFEKNEMISILNFKHLFFIVLVRN